MPATVLRQRLIYGFTLAGAITGLLLLDGFLTTRPAAEVRPGCAAARQSLTNGAICAGMLGTFVWLAAGELLRLARSTGLHPPGLLTRLACTLFAIGPYLAFHAPPESLAVRGWEGILLAAALGAAFCAQAAGYRTQGAISGIGAAMLIIIYLGGLAHFLLRLRMDLGGRLGTSALLFSIFIVKMTDVGAYFTGRYFGRRKLIPWLSPNKTWEGLFGGLATGALCAVAVGIALHGSSLLPPVLPALPFGVTVLVFGILMSVLSVLGDLCASLLKRDAAVKDSGAVLPGFGGVLDVLDSPLLAAPAAWLFWTALPAAAQPG
jgi:phosphatidate cytidylyltransferase